MNASNLKHNVLLTVSGKGLILVLNFAVVVLSTRFWGAEGKGSIALFAANLSLVTVAANIFTGSSVSYFLPRFGALKLFMQAHLWVFLVSVLFSIGFHIADYTFPALLFFTVSVLLGCITFHSSLYIGEQKIPYYNLVTLLQPLLLLGFMLAIRSFIEAGYYAYFYAQICSLLIVLLISRLITRHTFGKITYTIDRTVLKSTFHFGWKIELSNFLQFLNYRLSFYFLNYYLGKASLGVFSIGVALSEAIWVISRSISLVQYSNVIRQGNTKNSRDETRSMSWYSALASLACLVIACCIPETVYAAIFGPEFAGVQEVIVLLSPGILAISLSNVYGNYFSAIGKTGILIFKSATGVLVTVVLSFLLIPNLEMTGACLVNSGSYLISSLILVWAFFRKKARL